MTKYKLQTLLKQQTGNRHTYCQFCPKELQLCKDIFDGIYDVCEEILLKTDSSERWGFLNSNWSELTGFTVQKSIGNSFIDDVHSWEYQRNLELFEIIKTQQIEETAYKTRYKTKSGDVCIVKIHNKLLIDNQSQMIGTFGKLKLVDFENQSESHKREQHQFDNQYDGEVILGNHRKYLEALVNLETALQNFDGSDESYREILSILGLAYQPSRVYIFENHRSKNGDLLINQKAEWCNTAIASKFEPKNFPNQPITEIFPRLQKILARGNAAWGTVGEFGFEENKFLEARGVISVLFLPIIIKGEFFGFIGLDDCVVNRVWQSTEIAFLQATVGVISLAYENLLTKNHLSKTIKEYQILNLQLEDKINLCSVELQKEQKKREGIEKKLEESVSLQKTTLETTADGILLVDSQGFIAGYNHQFLEMWNIPQSLIKSGNYAQVLEFATSHLKDPQEYIISVNQLLGYPGAEIDDLIELKDGRVFERYSQPQYIGGKIVGRVWSFRDISERFQAEATITHQASHDLLTNLPNRMQFNLRLLESLIKANQSNSKLAVCFLDLDRFKTINETLGHGIGDKLLKSVAHRLNKCLRSRDILARWGGDEFTLLLSDINGVRDAARVAEEVLTALKPGFLIDNHLLHISASIGIAVYPNHGKDGETLIKNADAALNRAKLDGRNHYQIYNSAINSQASELLSLENSLHYALERNELRLYYQPQVDITTGEICKFEALLRWEHPKYGLISPSKFIPIAEETGLIIPISEWVLRTACIQNKIWQNLLGLSSVGVAVNLSARQFQQLNLVNTVRRILTETKLSPQYLELEITESAAMQNVEFSKEILTQLHDMGVSISIDDFGTGYCSFNYLKQFPINCLKIDRSFVRDLTNDTNDAAIITAMIALAHGLNLSVVAEGVETEEQRNLLRILECEIIQGNLFSPAVCAQQATELLLKSHSRLIHTSVLVA
ncbi:MAG: EAL domain-containing protein [Richelia sp. RM2_1_2]|nr:EAL domain-containing protein [Richelia sp. SM1_7_0]NJN07961.1 EAL domain-containing protein [Richelia sp. RM1_1_1]NJO29220.1 EAL domain-containing protein [Richelia sp. SL_2_1]NJO61703.1 EAL domain-containing protein [Richelia sp. RM2_1_2]